MRLSPSPFLSFDLCISSLSFCLFSLFFSASDHCPCCVDEETTGGPQTEKFPQVFSYYCLLFRPFPSFTQCPFCHPFSPLFLLLSRWFLQAACHCCRSCPRSHFISHLQHEYLEICISTMTAFYMASLFISLLLPPPSN